MENFTIHRAKGIKGVKDFLKPGWIEAVSWRLRPAF
jgi:hypothetical protein